MGVKFLTLNLRHNADRWPERRALVIDQLLAEQADVIALQEVRLEIRQAHDLADALNARLGEQPYRVALAPKWEPEPDEGVALLSRPPIAEHERLELPGDGGRVAQRIRVEINGRAVDIANTHLHHRPYENESVRLPQVEHLLRWMFARGDGVARRWLLAGDFNATPESATVQAVQARLHSAYPSVHGVEPVTFPSPLVAEPRPALTIDYIFFDPAHFRATDARVTCNRPHPDDPALCPSDHFGLAAAFLVL